MSQLKWFHFWFHFLNCVEKGAKSFLSWFLQILYIRLSPYVVINYYSLLPLQLIWDGSGWVMGLASIQVTSTLSSFFLSKYPFFHFFYTLFISKMVPEWFQIFSFWDQFWPFLTTFHPFLFFPPIPPQFTLPHRSTPNQSTSKRPPLRLPVGFIVVENGIGVKGWGRKKTWLKKVKVFFSISSPTLPNPSLSPFPISLACLMASEIWSSILYNKEV